MTAHYLALALLGCAAGAQAQTSTPQTGQVPAANAPAPAGQRAQTGTVADTQDRQPGDGNAAVRDNNARTTTAPAEGANSFTEDQARSRLADAGYTDISTLTRNDNGQWTGTASQAGRKVQVMLDYKGNIATSDARTGTRTSGELQ